MQFYGVILLTLFSNLCSMELDTSGIRKEILQNLEKNNHTNVIKHLGKLKEKLSSIFEPIHQNPEVTNHKKSSITDELNSTPILCFYQQAQQQAETNLENAKKELTWFGNTGRRNQAFVGLMGILFGLAKGGYELFLYKADETDNIKNGFDIAGDLTAISFGAYNIKLAWQNSAAKGEYEKSKLALQIIKDQQSSLQQLAEMAKRIEEKVNLLHQSDDYSHESEESLTDSNNSKE